MVVQVYKDSKSILFEDYIIMILDKIVEKILIKNIKKIRDNGIQFINNNKDEIIEMIKVQIKKYIDEHKDEIIEQAKKKALELIKESKLGLDAQEIEEYYAKLQSYIEKIQDKDLHDFVATQFEQYPEFKVMPAAKLMHHNYIGGLLVHTVECVEFAELNMAKFAYKTNPDEIIAACLLHDFGKIFEYTIDLETGLIDYAPNFREEWISHSQYGFCICMNAGFKKVAKMIAAHHGRAEWGAIIDLDQKDLEPELYLIHFIDNLSAKFGKISTRLLEQKEG